MNVHVHILTANLAAHGLRNHLGGLLRGVVSTGCCWGFFTRLANGSSLGGGVYEGRSRGGREVVKWAGGMHMHMQERLRSREPVKKRQLPEIEMGPLT